MAELDEAPLSRVQCGRCAGEGVVGAYFDRRCPDCDGEGWLVEELEPNDADDDEEETLWLY